MHQENLLLFQHFSCDSKLCEYLLVAWGSRLQLCQSHKFFGSDIFWTVHARFHWQVLLPCVWSWWKRWINGCSHTQKNVYRRIDTVRLHHWLSLWSVGFWWILRVLYGQYKDLKNVQSHAVSPYYSYPRILTLFLRFKKTFPIRFGSSQKIRKFHYSLVFSHYNVFLNGIFSFWIMQLITKLLRWYPILSQFPRNFLVNHHNCCYYVQLRLGLYWFLTISTSWIFYCNLEFSYHYHWITYHIKVLYDISTVITGYQNELKFR